MGGVLGRAVQRRSLSRCADGLRRRRSRCCSARTAGHPHRRDGNSVLGACASWNFATPVAVGPAVPASVQSSEPGAWLSSVTVRWASGCPPPESVAADHELGGRLPAADRQRRRDADPDPRRVAQRRAHAGRVDQPQPVDRRHRVATSVNAHRAVVGRRPGSHQAHVSRARRPCGRAASRSRRRSGSPRRWRRRRSSWSRRGRCGSGRRRW